MNTPITRYPIRVEQLAQSEIENAVICLQLGQIVKAEKLAKRALTLDARQHWGHNVLGCILLQQGKLTEAEVCFRNAIGINPNYADAHINLGNVLRDLGRISEAEHSLRCALELKPACAETFYYLGETLNIDEGESYFHKTLDINPDHALALVSLSRIATDRGQSTEAENYLHRALDVSPNNPQVLANILNLRRITPDDAKLL